LEQEIALVKAIQEIERLRRRYPVRSDGHFSVRYGNCIPQCFAESGASGCWAGVSYCTIDPWGRLRPCNHSPTVAGSLFEHSLLELWHGSVMQGWRQLAPEGCLTCGAYEICHGSCRALMELQQVCQDPLMKNPIQPSTAHYDVEIYRYAKPRLVSEMLSAEPGMALVRGLSIFPVSDDAIPLLNTLDGQQTLEQLFIDHGQDGLNFIGELVRRGYVQIV
jgi:radical SAM protein with 4Fe4S-binding SPASM domain